MESRWTFEISEIDLRDQNSIACDVLYIIRKLLERRCLKWAHIAHLDIWNTSYGQKKGRPVWPPTRKSRESTRFTWLQTTCHIPLESSWWELQLFFWSHFDQRSSCKVMRLQSRGSPCWWDSPLARFRDSHAGVLGEKNHLDVGPVERSRIYYKGEGGGFPQVRDVVSLVCPCCPWFVLAQRVLQLCTNHFVWVVCRPVWVNKLVNFS